MPIVKTILGVICSFLLLLSSHSIALAVSNSDLPWNWLTITSNGNDFGVGIGTRDPNLGDPLGLELTANYKNNKIDVGLDLLYFLDLFDSISFNLGLGIDKDYSRSDYEITYATGAWFPIGNGVLGVGFHTHRGLCLRYSGLF